MEASALAAAEAVINGLGYDHDSVARDYAIWRGQGRGIARADLVAFARPEPRDMSTAVIAFEFGAPDQGFEIARLLGAPYFFVPGSQLLDLWLAGLDAPTLWRRDVGPADVPDLLDWLRPESAFKSKIGLRQLPLFALPVNFLARAREDGADRLAPMVVRSMSTATDELAPQARRSLHQTRLGHRAASRLVVGALTALVLRDRDRQLLRGLAPPDLIAQVSADHPKTFGWVSALKPREEVVFRELLESLGAGIDYQSLDPSILSYVYEEALVDEAERHDLGIFYTPPDLATQLARIIPFELLAPQQRYVLDPACGSGTLLVAAHDRLRDLQPGDWPPGVRHEDLAVHLRGFDIDPFASEIARLTMFLHAQPAGNGWQIESRDTIAQPAPESKPRVILTNPPWRYTSETNRSQAADAFVEWSVSTLAPGGFLGMLLPGSWLSSQSSAAARAKLMSECEVFELWRIAQGAFPNSRASTAVLVARKRDGPDARSARAVTEVSKRQLEPFLDGRGVGARYLQPDALESLEKGPAMPKLGADTTPLARLATILSGQQPLPSAANRGSGNVRFLNQFGDVRVYGLVDDSVLWHLDFPDDFQSARGQRIISKKKVLASAARSSEGPWRFRVAIDPLGVAVRNSMRGIAPHEQDDADVLYAIAIIVGSAFASAFAATYVTDRNISAKVLPALPIPSDRAVIAALAAIGRRAACASTPSGLSAVLIEAESAVWAAYGVSEQDVRLTTARFSGEFAPEGYVRYAESPASESRQRPALRRVGAVLDVDGSYVRLWVNGLTPSDGVIVPLPATMPGWMARTGATFDVHGVQDLGDLANGQYTFQPMAWQDADLTTAHPQPLVFDESNDFVR